MNPKKRHTMVLIGGPNGAGKSTFIRQYIASHDLAFVLLNADEIAREGASLSPMEAGRILLERLSDHVANRRNVIVETTLSGVGYARQIPKWQTLGYHVILHYLALASVEASIERVRQRVLAGGHDIPVPALRRRFDKSLNNFDNRYKPIVDAWYHRRSEAGGYPIQQYFERGSQ